MSRAGYVTLRLPRCRSVRLLIASTVTGKHHLFVNLGLGYQQDMFS
jgi:hypothetical protein